MRGSNCSKWYGVECAYRHVVSGWFFIMLECNDALQCCVSDLASQLKMTNYKDLPAENCWPIETTFEEVANVVEFSQFAENSRWLLWVYCPTWWSCRYPVSCFIFSSLWHATNKRRFVSHFWLFTQTFQSAPKFASIWWRTKEPNIVISLLTSSKRLGTNIHSSLQFCGKLL